MLKIFYIITFISINLSAGWMFVNDDGTLSPYNTAENERVYSIPQQEQIDEEQIEHDTIIIKPKKRKHKHKKQLQITSRPIYGEQKIIYLTFDDGPLNGTQNVISVLSEMGVSATMFMIGKHVKQNQYRKNMFLRAIDEPNIMVANHTYSHANGHYRRFYSNINKVVSDLNKMNKKLEKEDPNHSMKCCRLAGRNVFRVGSIRRNDAAIRRSWEYNAYDALADEGFEIFGWDYQWDYRPRDGKLYKSPAQIVKIIEKINKKHRTRKPNKVILLMHDFTFKNKFNGKEKLRELISLLDQHGWSFETLQSY